MNFSIIDVPLSYLTSAKNIPRLLEAVALLTMMVKNNNLDTYHSHPTFCQQSLPSKSTYIPLLNEPQKEITCLL